MYLSKLRRAYSLALGGNVCLLLLYVATHLTGSVQTVEKKPTQDCLTIDDLSEVQRYFWNVRACWKHIGSELGIDQGSISAFERTYKGCVDDCLLEVLKTWLRKPNCSRLKMKKVFQSPMVLQAIQDSE